VPGEDRIHAGNLAVVAEGHAEDPGRGISGHHGQLVEAAAALALRPDRAMARVVQVHHACQLLSGRRRAAEESTMPGARQHRFPLAKLEAWMLTVCSRD
jgi:hypothetical protein